MTWWYYSEADVHERTHQKLTNWIIFGETHNNVIYLQNVFSVFHDSEETHFRYSRITDVDSDEQLVLKQYRLPCDFRIASYLQLERDLCGTFVAGFDYIINIGRFALFREKN